MPWSSVSQKPRTLRATQSPPSWKWIRKASRSSFVRLRAPSQAGPFIAVAFSSQGMRRDSRRATTSSREGPDNVTVAVRGPPPSGAISPSTSPGPRSPRACPSRSARAEPYQDEHLPAMLLLRHQQPTGWQVACPRFVIICSRAEVQVCVEGQPVPGQPFMQRRAGPSTTECAGCGHPYTHSDWHHLADHKRKLGPSGCSGRRLRSFATYPQAVGSR